MAQALEANSAHGVHGTVGTPHCEACAARAAEAEKAANLGLLGRWRAAFTRWLNALNGTPVLDISRGDLGSIRRLAEA